MNDHIEPHTITWGKFMCFLFGHPKKDSLGKFLGSIPCPEGSDPTEVPDILFGTCKRCGEVTLMKVWHYKPGEPPLKRR